MDRVRNLTREYRASQWAGIIKECRDSGQTIRSWCDENGIGEKSYYYWQRRLRENACQVLEQSSTPGLPAFAEVSISRASNPEAIAVTLRMGEITAEIHNRADPTTLEAVIRTLKILC